MQSFYPASFEREMGCTPAEWLMWLPAAMGQAQWVRQGDALQARLAEAANATLQIDWRVGEPRRIALMNIPRLHVRFVFSGLDDAQRFGFMKRFDLYMQRGGG